MNPLGRSVAKLFLLPNRHVLLEPVDKPLRCLERDSAMRRTDHHGNARLADRHLTQPVNQQAFDQLPPLARGGFEFRELRLSHALISFVTKLEGLFAGSELTSDANKGHHRTGRWLACLLHEGAEVDRLVGERDHRCRGSLGVP